MPGGFGYLVSDPGECRATSARDQRSYSSTGNTPPAQCSAADFASWVGRTVLLPIFDQYGGTGSNAWYRVYGYAAFTIDGFDLGGSHTTGKTLCGKGGDARCIVGRFVRYVEPSDSFFYDATAPAMGSWILRLIR